MGLFLAATWLDKFADATARALKARNQGWKKAQDNQCNYQLEPDMDLNFIQTTRKLWALSQIINKEQGAWEGTKFWDLF